MKFIEALHLLAVICLLSSCGTQYAYFQTPFHTNASAYKTQPQVRDSVRSAVYASGAFTIGGANHHSRDDVMGFMGSIYRAHSGRHIQGYYGITGVLGQYKIEKYQYAGSTQNQYDNLNLNDSLINLDAGYHSFAGWGAVGGLNWVLPFRNWEWRALGVEASWLHEYGSYLKFRQQLPDTAANILDRRNRFFTIGLNTDFVFYARKGSGGIKMGMTGIMGRLNEFDKLRQPSNYWSAYFSHTIHFELKRLNGYFQLNIGGRAISMITSLTYRLTK